MRAWIQNKWKYLVYAALVVLIVLLVFPALTTFDDSGTLNSSLATTSENHLANWWRVPIAGLVLLIAGIGALFLDRTKRIAAPVIIAGGLTLVGYYTILSAKQDGFLQSAGTNQPAYTKEVVTVGPNKVLHVMHTHGCATFDVSVAGVKRLGVTPAGASIMKNTKQVPLQFRFFHFGEIGENCKKAFDAIVGTTGFN